MYKHRNNWNSITGNHQYLITLQGNSQKWSGRRRLSCLLQDMHYLSITLCAQKAETTSPEPFL